MQETVDKMWKRFMREVVPQYQFYQKWRNSSRNLKDGDVVILMGEKRRNRWPVGVVERVHEGTDGLVREAEVRFHGENHPKRISIIRLALLCPAGEENGFFD